MSRGSWTSNMKFSWCLLFAAFFSTIQAFKYDPAWTQYNLNTNQSATNPINYWGEWSGHTYTPSPNNWRFPFYTLFLDRFVNGDPSNDNSNNTAFEHDLDSNQMRNGGDLQGLIDTLDYLQGMGVKALYIAGSPFMNQPWGYDAYSPVDLSLLDPHFGTIDAWRTAVNAIHERGMYVILDNTFATMGDLIGFEGYLNTTAPFLLNEHKVRWKTDRQYLDFKIGNNYNTTCSYPRFWLETGFPVGEGVTKEMVGCYDSDFDQYGDTEAFGVFPDWRRQLSKFASVQDRLREWDTPVREKIENFYCMMIAQLDIDGYRYDKATQSTVDAMGYMNSAMRQCARRHGKQNFFLPGEITGGNVFGSIFLGRGRQPDMLPDNLTFAVTMTNNSADRYFLRDHEYGGLDSGAFHYTVYRTLTRFLGMDGNLEAGYDAPPNWVDMWNDFLLTNDMVNPNTGKFDPRHMYGVTNQDVFRWPGIKNGVQRQLLGHFITTITLPGIPLLLWGEEQAFYIFDNTATNYIFGRQAMTSNTAWKTHGCYSFPNASSQYFEMPVEAARTGCQDEKTLLDHRDPSHPVRNIIRRMYHLREQFPVLNDGYFLMQLSNQSQDVYYPGSGEIPTETGLWSVMRSQFEKVQDLTSQGGAGDLPVWLVYSNLNASHTYQFDCSNNDVNMNITALIAPFDSGTTVKNLFYPYDEQTLQSSARTLGIRGSTKSNGCLSQLPMEAYGYRAYVPVANWVGPAPMITYFSPGHDARILTTSGANDSQTLDVELQFSVEMSCSSVTNSITFTSSVESSLVPSISGTPTCTAVQGAAPTLVGGIASVWSWKATLQGVTHGVHQLTIKSPSSSSGGSTNATDHFLFRYGAVNNPIIFPVTANYSSTLLNQDGDRLYVSHSAAGANQWRYSTNWGTTFSDWMPYTGGNSTITRQPWSGTKKQAWTGDHVRVEYYNRLGGSSSHVQQGDLDPEQYQRRFPHLFLNGPYNQYGYDAGLDNEIVHSDHSTWEHHFMTEWQESGTLTQINVWGINPDGKPDQTYVFGDADGDSVLDRLPPSSLTSVVLNITKPPVKPYLAYRFVIDDATLKFRLVPVGPMYGQIALYILLWVMPIIFAATAVWLFMQSFYKVKFNKVGITEKATFIPMAIKAQFKRKKNDRGYEQPHLLSKFKTKSKFIQSSVAVTENRRRTVLIATMEYDIEDWAIKIKIGGLGVMAQLMGKNLGHQDLIWVVPCVGDVEYPTDTLGESILVTILGKSYEVQVQFHILRNITYVLLDAPVFRQQTKSEPYPPRMDDMSSAIYYSAWNQCIAQVINRFPIDLYHINDYHGSIAPLYLLPRTIPACLSLHNAEFQGLWPMRNKQERDEVCSVFNLPTKVAQEYVQFGEVFNLLHAGASYLRVQQQGFGAVGVSKKYGKRAYARYPIFWGLKKVGKLPNPDPSDTGEWDKKLPKEGDIHVDPDFEAARPELKRQAQEWAGLKQDPNAELFVFVGRWSMQKGIDLIADIFPSILEAHPQAQLITVGPVIDLYGKFAALKLDRMMQVYPGRVCSKPVFTALPPFIFSGAEFALIPSRDEPFGLVAVEFGRKGALGVGARVGGLGQMPGWWFTVESMTTSHLLHQFRLAIEEALSSKTDTRAMMRARSAKQRFPVAQWVEDLEILQTTAIRIHNKVEATKRHSASEDMIKSSVPAPPLDFGLGADSLALPAEIASPSQPPSRVSSSGSLVALGQRFRQLSHSGSTDRLPEQVTSTRKPSGLSRQVSLGSRRGPGHARAAYVANREAAGKLPRVQDTPNTHSMVLPEDYDTDDSEQYSDEDENVISGNYMAGRRRVSPSASPSPSADRMYMGGNRDFDSPSPSADRMYSSSAFQSATDLTLHQQSTAYDMSPMLSPHVDSHLMPPPMTFQEQGKRISASPSLVSVNDIVGEKTDFKLQKVDPFFTDSSGAFYQSFSKKLEDLNGTNSESNTCIEEFLVKSEKKWFDSFRNAKLGRSSRRPSYSTSRNNSRAPSRMGETDHESESDFDGNEEFLLGKDYTPPTGLRKWMQLRVGDWPVYSIFMAFGQIVAANSYQITLLTGEVGQTATKLYWIASVYLVTSMLWWVLFRRFSSVFCLSLPFLFYGLAFVFIGCAHYGGSAGSTAIVQNFGTACYAVASSSGSIFFALNFGDEGGAQVKAWVFRACVIQGTQQAYVVALWYWGSVLSKASQAGEAENSFANSWGITALCLPLALIFWAVGVLMWLGLPNYYRQQPGAVPNFYKSLMRRKIVLWFFFTVIVQNFFLSAPYGRNWSFLFSSYHAATWQVLLLTAAFFIGVWSLFLWVFGIWSKSHSWILPIFAIGLGAPRWAQIWWGTSNIGTWLPWAGGYTASALISRALWLWLGVLDAIQGVGLGMILLGTLTRVHVAFTLITAQVLGSVATIVARACAPNRIGPGPISPDISGGISNVWTPWFWVGLVMNLVVCIGYFMFYRKEQLAKP